MLTAMILKGGTDAVAAYHCRADNYYFKQASDVEEEFLGLTGEFPRRAGPLEYVKVYGGVLKTLGYNPGQAISETEFASLLEGKSRSGEKVARKHKVKAIDLTFSAPKSVSITGLVLEKNLDIIKAHDEAVLEVMKEIEACFAFARPNSRQQWATGKMCYATIRDGFSREHDPHLHTHVVVMNMTEWRGRIMGLWTRKILQKDFNKAFGELYRCRLGARLYNLGYRITYIKGGEWRLSKISRELEQEFSRRHGQIKSQKEAGLNDMASWRKSRAQKPKKMNKAEIVQGWLARLNRHVVNEADNIKKAIEERLLWSRTAEFNIEAAQEREGQRGAANEVLMWQTALRRATERTATASKQELVYEYLKETMRTGKWADVSYRKANARLQKQLERGYVVAIKDHKSERYTSLELMAAERGYMRYAGVDSAFDYSIDSRTAARYIRDLNEHNRRHGRKVLSTIQGRAVYEILTSKNMINVVQGDAGSGKTSSLKAVAGYYRQQGLDVIGLAMQGVAAKKLADETGVAAVTLRSYLARKKTTDRKVLIFDEASMLDSRNAEKLFKAVEQSGDKIILVGDMNQLEPINAGRVFERYVDYYARMSRSTPSVQLVVMNENYRQRTPVLRLAVDMAKRGEMCASLEVLAKDGRISEISDAGDRRAAIASLYDKHTLIIVGTTAARDDVNRVIRHAQRASGKLHNGREYVLARDNEDGIKQDRVMELAPGDVIAFTRNEYQKYDVRNGEKAEVLECGDNFLKVRMEDSRILGIDAGNYKDIDYGYALTTYKSQGQTYNRVIVEADTAISSLMDMRNQYVNITRARDDIQILTDDTARLKELAVVKTNARDTLEIVVKEGELAERLLSLHQDIREALPTANIGRVSASEQQLPRRDIMKE